MRDELSAQLFQRLRSEPQLLAHLARPARGGERLEERKGPVGRFADQRRQLVGARRRQARSVQDPRQLLLRGGVRTVEPARGGGGTDPLRVSAQFPCLREMSERPGEEPRRRRPRALPQLLLGNRRIDRCYGLWPPPVAGRARSSVRCSGLWPPPVAGGARFSVPE